MNFWNKNNRLIENIANFNKLAKIKLLNHNLINKVDSFISNAQNENEESYDLEKHDLADESADSEETDSLSKELSSAVEDVRDNKELYESLQILNTLYKHALNTDKGYAFTIAYINRIINEQLAVEESDEESDEGSNEEPSNLEFIEEILNGMFLKLKKYAIKNNINWKSDPKETLEQMQQIKNLKLQDLEKGIEDSEESENSDTEVGNNYSRLDLRGGAEDKINPGYGFGKLYSPKEWAKMYQTEVERYESLLQETNSPNKKYQIKELIEILNKLVKACTEQAVSLESIEFAKDPMHDVITDNIKNLVKERQKLNRTKDKDAFNAIQTKINELIKDRSKFKKTTNDPIYNNLKNEIKELRSKRHKFKSSIRDEEIRVKNNSFEKILQETSSPKLKFIIEQRIAYNNLIQSNMRNKKQESDLRRKLIDSFNGFNITKEMIDNPQEAELKIPLNGNEHEIKHIKSMLEKIEEASKLKIEPYYDNIEKAKELAKIKKTIKEEGKKNKYDWDNMDLPGFIKHMGLQVPTTARKTIKDKIIREMGSLKMNVLKSYIEDVSKSADKISHINKELINKPNDVSLKNSKTQAIKLFIEASKTLESKINEEAINSPLFKVWIIAARTAEFFFSFRNGLIKINEFDLNNLTNENINYIKSVITQGQILTNNYKNYSTKLNNKSFDLSYSVAVEYAEKATNFLKKLIPNEKIENRNLPVIKASILDRLNVFNNLIKTSQSILEKIESDTNPDEIANELFNKLLLNIDIDKLEKEIKL